MSKVKYDDPVKSLKGKICKHSETIYKEMYGTNFTTKICNPRDLKISPYTEKEVTVHNLFKQARAAADAIMADSEQKAEAIKRFLKQKNESGKYATPRGMLIAEQFALLKADAGL